MNIWRKKKMSNKTKIRRFELMNEVKKVNIDLVINWLDGIDCKYLIVKHDKDLPREPHYHCFVAMANARTIEDIAKHCKVEEQYINFVKNWKNAMAYAFHMTAKSEQDGKYKYDATAVVGLNGVSLDQVFETAQSYKEKNEYDVVVKELLYKYGDCGISKNELLRKLTSQDFDKHYSTYKHMRELRVEKVRNREMKVIYITGASGTGKTTLAKYFARVYNYDVFVSGSGADVLDGYDKEECIILDDLRGDIFKKAELFKLTDNNTNSSVKSRFKNKDISFCKLMIITSVKAPQNLYNWTNNDLGERDEEETFKQLARRLGNCYLKIEENGCIYQCDYDIDMSGRVAKKTMIPFSMSGVYQTLGIEKVIGADLMTNIYAKVLNDMKDHENPNSENVDSENEGLESTGK